MTAKLKSYTSLRSGLQSRFTDIAGGIRNSLQDPGARVAVMIERLQGVESVVSELRGGPLEGCDVLEIGPGQLFPQMIYFSRLNRVTGIDLDVLARGFDPRPYWRMLRRNGPMRLAKTLARKTLRYDARYQRELARRLGMDRLPPLNCVQMDATEMRFGPDAFDAVFSFSVFEHLPDPAKALNEIRRVLRPGGVAYISIHLYTSDNGCHDPRLYTPGRGGLPLWPHLRPAHQHRVRPNAYLNKVRLAQWQDIFQARMPGARFIPHVYDEEQTRAAAEALKRGGELAEYADEELITTDFAVAWKKARRRA